MRVSHTSVRTIVIEIAITLSIKSKKFPLIYSCLDPIVSFINNHHITYSSDDILS